MIETNWGTCTPCGKKLFRKTWTFDLFSSKNFRYNTSGKKTFQKIRVYLTPWELVNDWLKFTNVLKRFALLTKLENKEISMEH